jgi:hypothetical protein
VAITVLLLRYLLPTAQTSLADLSETALRDADPGFTGGMERNVESAPAACAIAVVDRSRAPTVVRVTKILIADARIVPPWIQHRKFPHLHSADPH